MASLYDANKGVWNVHKRLILWCSSFPKIQNWVAVSGACFYSGSKERCPCLGRFTVFSILIFLALLFSSCSVPEAETQQRECAGPRIVSFVFLHENVMLFQLNYPIEDLPLGSALPLREKCPKCAMVAKEMLGEAEMTCSFEKRWFKGWERRSMCALPLHTVDLSMWSLLSLPLLCGHEKNLPGMKAAVLLHTAPSCPSLPCPLALPASRACLDRKANLRNLA